MLSEYEFKKMIFLDIKKAFLVLMKKIKIFFLIFGSVFLLGFISYIFLGPLSKISFVELHIDKELKKSQFFVKKEQALLSYLKNYQGQSLWKIDLKTMVKEVNAFHLGSEAYVRRSFPNRLNVFLKKKETALLLLKEREIFYSISYEGEIGNKRSLKESFDFPILRGKAFWNRRVLRERVLSLLAHIPKEGAFFSVQNISEISHNKVNDSFLFYLTFNSFILELKAKPSINKITNIDFVLKYLNQRGDQGGWIDASFEKKIIVKNLN